MSAKPRTMLGKLLLKAAPWKLGDMAINDPARRQLTERCSALRVRAQALPFPALSSLWVTKLSEATAAEGALDGLPTASARGEKLTELEIAVEAVATKIALAEARTAEYQQVVDRLRATRATLDAAADAPAKAGLALRLQTLERGLVLGAGSSDVTRLSDTFATLARAAVALDDDIAAAARHLAAQEAARRNAAAALPALLQRARAARTSAAGSPAMQALLAELQAAESALPTPLSADNAQEASRLMVLLAIAAGKVEAKAADEAAAYGAALAAARSARAALVAPVLGGDVAPIDAALAAAERRAAAGERHLALADLVAVQAECARVAPLATAYEGALAAAEAVLLAARPKMLAGDADAVQSGMIDAAKTRAAAGQRQGAHDLLARVQPHCAAAEAADLPVRYPPGLWLPDLLPLVNHPQRAAFVNELASLNQRLETAKALLADGAVKGAHREMSLAHFDAQKQRAFADLHQIYATARDPIRQRLEQLKLEPPVASNAGIAGELAELEGLLLRAEGQAGKRRYDAAEALLRQLDAGIASAAARKRAHATFARALERAEPRVQALVGAPGTPAAADAAAASATLQQARALAVPGGDFAAALALLERAERHCGACDAVQAASVTDSRTRDAALAGLDSDTAAALRELRQWLVRLRAGPGQAGIGTELAEIERLLAEADAALAT